MSNLTAFLTTIAHSEGTEHIGERGYNCIVGSRVGRSILFTSYRDHPRIRVQIKADDPGRPGDDGLWSTAAGRYQVLARYFDAYQALLALPDFSPASQDAIATKMIREQDAYAAVMSGLFDIAIARCANIWASLPGAGYGQHEQRIADLRSVFTTAGGLLA